MCVTGKILPYLVAVHMKKISLVVIRRCHCNSLQKNHANYVALSPLSFLEHSTKHYPNVPAYFIKDRPYSWQESSQRINSFSSSLNNKFGIRKGDVVSIMAPNCATMFESHFAVPGSGAILHSINTRQDVNTIAFQIRHSRSKLIIVDSEFGSIIREALELLPKNESRPIIVDSIDPSHDGSSDFRLCGDGKFLYEELISYSDASSNLNSNNNQETTINNKMSSIMLPNDEWDAIALNYTSGTTGNPKGVVCHHRGAYLNALDNIISWEMGKFPQYLWIVPMFHCNGWSFPWTLAAAAGTCHFLRQIQGPAIFELIEKYKIQYFCGAPITMNIMMAWDKKFKFKHSVKMLTAGAPPPPPVIAKFEEATGVRVITAWGMTETYGPISTHIPSTTTTYPRIFSESSTNITGDTAAGTTTTSTTSPPEKLDHELLFTSPQHQLQHQLTSIITRQGVGIFTEEAMVKDPKTMLDVPADGTTIGELMIRGNTVMKGYLENDKANEEAFSGGWFHTGDLAVLHSDGRFELKDRSKDIIISGGENISSIEVENILLQHPKVLEVAVVAMEDYKWGEVPCAFIITTTTTTTAMISPHVTAVSSSGNSTIISSPEEAAATSSDFEREILQWAKTKMAGFKTPKKVIICSTFPKTNTGKVQKHLLRKSLTPPGSKI